MGEHVPESSGGITKETVTGSQQSLSGIPESLQTPDSGQARLQELGESCRSPSTIQCIAWRDASAELPMLIRFGREHNCVSQTCTSVWSLQ